MIKHGWYIRMKRYHCNSSLTVTCHDRILIDAASRLIRSYLQFYISAYDYQDSSY